MQEYIDSVIDFCKREPIWALAFFVCGFIIGDTYFTL